MRIGGEEWRRREMAHVDGDVTKVTLAHERVCHRPRQVLHRPLTQVADALGSTGRLACVTPRA